VVHSFAAPPSGLDGNGQVLFEIALAREIGKTPRPQPGFELRFFFQRSRGNDPLVSHVISAYNDRAAAWRKSGRPSQIRLRILVSLLANCGNARLRARTAGLTLTNAD